MKGDRLSGYSIECMSLPLSGCDLSGVRQQFQKGELMAELIAAGSVKKCVLTGYVPMITSLILSSALG